MQVHKWCYMLEHESSCRWLSYTPVFELNSSLIPWKCYALIVRYCQAYCDSNQHMFMQQCTKYTSRWHAVEEACCYSQPDSLIIPGKYYFEVSQWNVILNEVCLSVHAVCVFVCTVHDARFVSSSDLFKWDFSFSWRWLKTTAFWEVTPCSLVGR